MQLFIVVVTSFICFQPPPRARHTVHVTFFFACLVGDLFRIDCRAQHRRSPAAYHLVGCAEVPLDGLCSDWVSLPQGTAVNVLDRPSHVWAIPHIFCNFFLKNEIFMYVNFLKNF